MLLLGTTYKSNCDFGQISKDLVFTISLDTDPKNTQILIESNKLPDNYPITKEELFNYCELLTDFSQAIYFYIPQDEFGMFSNFSEHGIMMKDKYYPTVEHYYQSCKFENMMYQELIRNCHSPKRASELGKSKDQKIKSNWNEIKIEVMYQAVLAKFQQNKAIQTILLNTQNHLLIENSPYDNFWGIGKTGQGLNYLGTILMKARKKFLTQK